MRRFILILPALAATLVFAGAASAGVDLKGVDASAYPTIRMASLPADAAILVAAVADWRVEASPAKLKKGDGPPKLKFVPTRDILAELGTSEQRPRLLVGFAAETERVVEHGRTKRAPGDHSPDISRWFSPWPAIRRRPASLGFLTHTRKGGVQGFGSSSGAQADLAARVAVEPAREVQLEQRHLHGT